MEKLEKETKKRKIVENALQEDGEKMLCKICAGCILEQKNRHSRL